MPAGRSGRRDRRRRKGPGLSALLFLHRPQGCSCPAWIRRTGSERPARPQLTAPGMW